MSLSHNKGIILSNEKWHDLGSVDALKDPPLREITVNKKKFALSYVNEEFGAVDNVCNHVKLDS